jgi:hypothetical protein
MDLTTRRQDGKTARRQDGKTKTGTFPSEARDLLNKE